MRPQLLSVAASLRLRWAAIKSLASHRPNHTEPLSCDDASNNPLRWLADSMAGYAVRVTWRDGTHNVMLFGRNLDSVERRMNRAIGQWRRSPVRPTSWDLIAIDRISYQVHKKTCSNPSCIVAGLSFAGGTR